MIKDPEDIKSIKELAETVNHCLNIQKEEIGDAVNTLLSIHNHVKQMNPNELLGWIDSQVPYWKHQLLMRHKVSQERLTLPI